MITSKVRQPKDKQTRNVIRVEIIEDYSALKAGTVTEVHPVLYKDLLKKGVCVRTTKPLGYTPKKVIETPVETSVETKSDTKDTEGNEGKTDGTYIDGVNAGKTE